MYDYIKGSFKGIFKDYVSIDNQGIGYQIFTSGNSMAMMPAREEETTLYLTQIVRQDFIGLYGFTSREELELFKILITINGVGAKAALSLLSASTPSHLKYAIVNGDEVLLMKAPGIGKKIAQRLILELKDKLHVENKSSMDQENQVSSEFDQNGEEALIALVTLGYTEREAKTILKTVEPNQSTEGIIKDALKALIN
ncbi:MAG: Holliday junction branch migration protein RuvA [Clostridium sp.]|nr:Holliday junction branch migration protein RuvA [Clostridium sp.]